MWVEGQGGIDSSQYIRYRYDNDGDPFQFLNRTVDHYSYLTYKSKESYEIFAVYSDKEDLYKIYNDPESSNLDLDQTFSTDFSGTILPKNNPLNFEKILYGLFFRSI